MAGTTTNVIQGAGVLYVADFGATEPTDSDVATAPGSAWTDVGYTNDSVELSVAQEYSDLSVDQEVDSIGARLVSRAFTISTNLAEATLDNLTLALNNSAPTTGASEDTWEPDAYSGGEPNYRALLFDGYAPNGKVRRIIVRKALQQSGVEFTYSKDDQTVFTVEFKSYHVSSSIRPFKVIDEK